MGELGDRPINPNSRRQVSSQLPEVPNTKYQLKLKSSANAKQANENY